MRRPTTIIFLQGIILLALLISIIFHKIITVFEYFKDNPDPVVSYVLAGTQFFAILYFVGVSYGLLKRKSFARWGSLLFFILVFVGYNVFVVLLGRGPIHFVKFSIINGISFFYIYMLTLSHTIQQFFWLGVPKVGVKKRLKNNMIFHDQ